MRKHPVKVITFLVLLVAIVPILFFVADRSYTAYWDENTANNSHLETTAVKKLKNVANKAVTTAETPIKESEAFKVSSKKPPYSIDGFDWSLPKDTKVEANSGLIDEYDRGIDYIRNVFVSVRWDEANPKQGQYDFSTFEKTLASISPKKALVRLEVNSACEAPKWALKQLTSSNDKSLIFWDKAYLKNLTPFIKAFAKRYAADPRIIGVHLGIGDGEYNGDCGSGSKDGWGEFWMSPESIATAQKKFGFNPDVFEKQTKAIIELYATAFGENRGKLAFTNIGPTFSWDDIADPYNEKLKLIAQHVWKAKLGNRDGDIEIWMRFLDKRYGVGLTSLADGTCAMDFNEDYATAIRGRYWGTENEFYGNKDYVIDANGPIKNQPYRFLISSLRALQMRRNYFSIAGDSMAKIKHPIYKTQEFLRYLTKVMGKQIENTPDAFILLGERYVTQDRASDFANQACVKNSEELDKKFGRKGVAIRSFGRWIKEASHSIPTMKTSMPASENYWGQDFYMPNGVDYEYFARKSQQFEFDINNDLAKLRCKNGCGAEVKITFKDTVKTDLTLWYDDGNVNNVNNPFHKHNQSHNNSYQRFKTKGDNKIKTVTFTVNSRFQSSLSNNLSDKAQGRDFIVNSKTADLSLIMIRVNFL